MANEQKASKLYGLLLGLSGLFALAAALTLIPWPRASWNNVLGYKSLCTFAPISAAICALLAEVTCIVRSRFFGPKRGQKRPWIAPAIVALALALVLGFSIPSYARAKADATSGATASSSQR